MSVTELRPTAPARSKATPKTGAKEAAEAEALRAKTAAVDITNQVKAAEAAVKVAESQAKADEIKRAADEKRRATEQQAAEAAAKREKAEQSAAQWRTYAKSIAIVCVLVSLPLQMMAFWSGRAPFLILAPLVLEGLAWVLLKGAEAAIDDHRPSWHYRALAGAVALFAAAVNFVHGSAAFGLGTGLGGAFCSIAGPMVWDLHEHGRIRKRDGKLSRAQRREHARKAAAEAAEKKAAEQQQADDREAMRESRAVQCPDVWARAVALAAALGELYPSEATWKRAWDDVTGAPLGDTAASIAARVAAKAAVKDATKDQTNTVEKVEKPQVESQLTTPRRTPRAGAVDGRRNNGGTPPRQHAGTIKYSTAARRAMSLASQKPRAAS
jgi:hypothetical protein